MGIRKRLRQAGPVSRGVAGQEKYLDYLARTDLPDCVFCAIPTHEPEAIIEDNQHTLVVKNQFPYSVWDGCDVLEHLMVLPKKHRDTLASFTGAEQAEWLKVCAAYEKKGYSLYTRSQDNITRSVLHHHTHFMRFGKARKKYLFYIRKPHILVAK